MHLSNSDWRPQVNCAFQNSKCQSSFVLVHHNSNFFGWNFFPIEIGQGSELLKAVVNIFHNTSVEICEAKKHAFRHKEMKSWQLRLGLGKDRISFSSCYVLRFLFLQVNCWQKIWIPSVRENMKAFEKQKLSDATWPKSSNLVYPISESTSLTVSQFSRKPKRGMKFDKPEMKVVVKISLMTHWIFFHIWTGSAETLRLWVRPHQVYSSDGIQVCD